MRDCRVLVLLGLCLLHSVCYGKPLEDKRSRVSTKAILKLESQLKDMAGEDDKPTTHRTTAKVPQLILPVDETEDSPPITGQDLEDPEYTEPQQYPTGQEAPDQSQNKDDETADVPEDDSDEITPQEAELFGKILEMAGEHSELLDMSVDDFQAILQKIQEREKEAELYAEAENSPEDEPDQQNQLSPEQMRERLQWLQGDEDAQVVAKKNVYPPVNILRRTEQEAEIKDKVMAKRQPEVIDKKSV